MQDISFGKGKWVFIDWLGIEPGYGTSWGGVECPGGFCVPHGIKLKAHSPDVLPGMCITLDEPWEKGTTGYATFLEDGGMFRCWYEHKNGIGYAESNDGITWRKPKLGLFELDGSTDNNLLDFYMHGGGVFIDPSAPSSERYKMVGCLWTEKERAAIGGISPDGLHWTHLSEPILPDNHADTQNICIYDEEPGSYVLYTRQAHGTMQRRGINRAISDDFHHFPPSVPVIECNPLDPPDWDYYCNGYSKWPGASAAHVMRISVYKHILDTVDVHLAISRDGTTWHRPLSSQPWISGGTSYPDPYTSLYACSGILQTDKGEWSTYAGAAHQTHNEPGEHNTQPAGIIRARMREDGFMSLSSEGPGEFWTIPFVLDSDTIRFNVKTSYSGFIKAELLASSGGDTGAETTANQAITGHSLADCIPISGNHIDTQLTWQTGANLDALRGQTVRLHIVMYNADLYAIKF